jgi:hypothetical protein
VVSDDERIATLEAHVQRLERGLLTLMAWLIQVPGCLGQHEYEPLRKIVQDEPQEPKQ